MENVKKVEPDLLVTRFGNRFGGGRKVMGMNCLWPSPRWAKKSFNNRGEGEFKTNLTTVNDVFHIFYTTKFTCSY